jgi:hypothetical protein
MENPIPVKDVWWEGSEEQPENAIMHVVTDDKHLVFEGVKLTKRTMTISGQSVEILGQADFTTMQLVDSEISNGCDAHTN